MVDLLVGMDPESMDQSSLYKTVVVRLLNANDCFLMLCSCHSRHGMYLRQTDRRANLSSFLR